jgi:hypothetical protein
MNLRQREADKRAAKLEAIDDRVADGSLTIRSMTDAERERFGIGDPDRPFKRFFFGTTRAGTRKAEDDYRRAAAAVRKEVGRAPTARRIFRVDCAVDGAPRRFQVGEPSPGGGAVVTAIFELAEPGELVASTADETVAVRIPAEAADVLDFA